MMLSLADLTHDRERVLARSVRRRKRLPVDDQRDGMSATDRCEQVGHVTD